MSNKFLIRSDEDYYEFGLDYCGKQMKYFKSRFFRKNSKYPARIYAKVFHPKDCQPKWFMRYIVFEVNGKAIDNSPITPEAFDVLTRNIESESYPSIDFYTISTHKCN